MKRSEAYSIIDKYLDDHSIYQISPDEILTLCLEELKMKPPTSYIETNGAATHVRVVDGKAIGLIAVNEWEKEDGKKD